ncbi:hypothetical protein HHI36_011820 [Cryptolaemus montrouzieri]|uniref:Methionyl-tRNA formyltransferase, mitochondrial n=1 Tax=Cryptolaemus montrouzieri TaxID=559131 RepID=A0ABD2NCT5_9CUCU
MMLILHKLIERSKYLYKQQHKFSNQVVKTPWNVLFFGTDEFSIFSLKALLNEYRKGQVIGKLEVCTSVKKLKNAVHLFAEKENLRLNEWPYEVPENEFHTGLVVSFGHLIPQRIIKKFPLGMINVHASLLPRWRGAAPIIYSLANGDSVTGVSIMKIKPKKFDTGEIISQKSVEIREDMYMPELHQVLGIVGANELIECLRDLPNKLENAKPQSQENITYAPKIDPTFSHINWKNMTSTQIYNLERAVKGFLPVVTLWKGEPIKLFTIEKLEENTENVSPGFIIYDNILNVLKVSCLDQKYVIVRKVQVFSKKL